MTDMSVMRCGILGLPALVRQWEALGNQSRPPSHLPVSYTGGCAVVSQRNCTDKLEGLVLGLEKCISGLGSKC
jgi:hypothetical protein